MPNPTVDRWVQRITAAALVLLALTLMGVGVALYAPASGGAQASDPAVVQK